MALVIDGVGGGRELELPGVGSADEPLTGAPGSAERGQQDADDQRDDRDDNEEFDERERAAGHVSHPAL